MKFLEKEIKNSPLFGLNKSDSIQSLQMDAIKEFNRNGLPDKNWEDWKYSDFSSLNKMSFAFGVRKNISSCSKIKISSFFDITHIHNFGVSFGLFSL